MNKLICTECNSEELSFKAWVDKNFQIEGINFINCDTDIWCVNCGEMKYSDLKEVKYV
jgi:hypothetical protein